MFSKNGRYRGFTVGDSPFYFPALSRLNKSPEAVARRCGPNIDQLYLELRNAERDLLNHQRYRNDCRSVCANCSKVKPSNATKRWRFCNGNCRNAFNNETKSLKARIRKFAKQIEQQEQRQRYCLTCGEPLKGRQMKFCCDAHRKEHGRMAGN